MKKFLLSITLFVLPAYILLAIGDYFFSLKATHSNLYHIENWYDLMQGTIDADIVAMGNSRTFVHINPIILDSVLDVNSYNLGFDGSSINRQIKKYNLYRKFNRKPKLIIQNIDNITLHYLVGYEMEQFFPYFWNMSLRKEFFSSEPFSIWDKYIPFYRYYHNLGYKDIYHLITSTKRNQTKGFQGKDLPWDGTRFRQIDTVLFVLNDESASMFDDYLCKVKDEGINIVFVYTPTYIGLTKKMYSYHQQMHDNFQKYANKYNIPILDYTDLDICYDTAFFYNSMHLNKKGADIFTDSLANDIKRLGLL